MGVVNTKSAAITNQDAAPPVLNSRASSGGHLQTAGGTVEVAAADSDASVFRLVRLPSNAIVRSIKRYNDAITGGSVYDCGIYQTAENGGAVVDADVFAANVDISAGTVLGVEERFTTANVDACESRLYVLLGLTVDPCRDYDLCWTGDTVGSGAGTLTTIVQYAT